VPAPFVCTAAAPASTHSVEPGYMRKTRAAACSRPSASTRMPRTTGPVGRRRWKMCALMNADRIDSARSCNSPKGHACENSPTSKHFRLSCAGRDEWTQGACKTQPWCDRICQRIPPERLGSAWSEFNWPAIAVSQTGQVRPPGRHRRRATERQVSTYAQTVRKCCVGAGLQHPPRENRLTH